MVFEACGLLAFGFAWLAELDVAGSDTFGWGRLCASVAAERVGLPLVHLSRLIKRALLECCLRSFLDEPRLETV